MQTRSVLRALAATALVVGCTAMGPALTAARAQAVPCPGQSCDVAVTVTGTPPAGPVVIAAKDIKLEKGKRNVVITWKLVGAPDFEFRADSIRPHTAAPVGEKKTTTAAAWNDQIAFLNNSATTYRARNKNTQTVALYYDIKVYHKPSGTPYTLDPVIFNDF